MAQYPAWGDMPANSGTVKPPLVAERSHPAQEPDSATRRFLV